MRRILRVLCTMGYLLVALPLLPTVEDNRYFPFYERVIPQSADKPSALGFDVFFLTAKKARARQDQKIPLGELHGGFDQVVYGEALIRAGYENPLRPDLQTVSGLPWVMNGKIQGHGFSFWYEQALGKYFSLGFDGRFMHISSRIEFSFPLNVKYRLGLDDSAVATIDSERRQAFKEVGLEAPQWSATGLGDCDAYIKIGKSWEYFWRIKRIDFRMQAGALIPSGLIRDEDNPASIPFGGNDHWGGYGALHFDMEMKEDWRVGSFVRLSKRKAESSCKRLSVLSEPHIFGVTSGMINVDPGLTFSFSPYISFEGIRDGLGFAARYTYVNHRKDCWTDEREDTSIPIYLGQAVEHSDWVAEYFSFHLFYDFGRDIDDPAYVGRFTLFFDAPADILGAKNVSKTHQVALGFELLF